MPSKTERYDKNCYRILVDGHIVAFALRMANARWALYDINDKRISKISFAKPKEVAEYFDALRADV